MFTLSVAQTILDFCMFVMAYAVVISCSGYLFAVILTKLGDDSIERADGVSFNPLVPVDFFGVIALYCFQIGWLKNYAPINYNGYIRPIVAYVLGTFIPLMFATVLLVCTLIFLDINMLVLSRVSLFDLSKIYPDASSLFLVGVTLMATAVYVSILIAAWNAIMQGMGVVIYYCFPAYMQEYESNIMLRLVAIFILASFAPYIIYAFTKLILIAAVLISYLFIR